MHFVLQPWQLFFIILVGWINRQRQEVIEYLRTENHVLKEKLGKKRILLNDEQRRQLTLFTPDTILRWHRKRVARKWDYSDRRGSTVGRPRVRQVSPAPHTSRTFVTSAGKYQVASPRSAQTIPWRPYVTTT